MTKQEITLKGLDGHEDHLVYDATNGKVGDSLEECACSLFPQEGETTPRLRFKGFEGEWKNAKAADLFVTFNERNRPDLPVLSACQDIRGMAVRSESGYDISHDRSNEVTYKVVRPGQFVIHLRSFQGGFAHSAVEGITSPAYTVFGFKNPERHDDYFWKIIFMSKAFIKRLETITYGIRDGRSISFEEFSNMDFLFPRYEEQKAIASFFRRLDAQIALRKNQFERLQQVKSACLDSMFPRGTEIAPPIRFNGFNSEWVITKLNEISKKVITKNTKLEYKVTLTNSAEHGIINQLDFFDHDISNGDNIRGYYVVENDDFVYNPRISTSAPVGPINRNQLGYAGVMSPLYYVFRVEGIDKDFLTYFFKTNRWHKFMYDNGNTGARFDRLSISDDVFGQMPISHPKDIAEQKCIATFFHHLDSHISTEQQRLERLKQMKSACLRSMFPQNGGGNFWPLVRFKGFDEEWITVCFADLFTFLKNNSLSRADLGATGRVKNVHYGDVLIKFGEIIDMNKEELPYITNDAVAVSLAEICQLKDGDVVFADAAEDNTVGKCTEIASIGNDVVVSGLHTIPCRPNQVFSEGFLGYCLNSNAFHDQLLPLIQGTKISSISKKALVNTYITYPKSLDEQRHISSFFRSLDTKISLQTQRIEKLKQMKTACLNKMIA